MDLAVVTQPKNRPPPSIHIETAMTVIRISFAFRGFSTKYAFSTWYAFSTRHSYSTSHVRNRLPRTSMAGFFHGLLPHRLRMAIGAQGHWLSPRVAGRGRSCRTSRPMGQDEAGSHGVRRSAHESWMLTPASWTSAFRPKRTVNSSLGATVESVGKPAAPNDGTRGSGRRPSPIQAEDERDPVVRGSVAVRGQTGFCVGWTFPSHRSATRVMPPQAGVGECTAL